MTHATHQTPGLAPKQTPSLFRIKVPRGASGGLRAYWVESTAPLNVDRDDPPLVAPALEEISDPDGAIRDIARYLRGCRNPQVVVFVHGFNNPFEAVLSRFQAAFRYLIGDGTVGTGGDPVILGRAAQDGLVCIGYQWPSERLGQPRDSLLRAAPWGLRWLFGASLLLLAAGLGLAHPRTRKWPGRALGHGLLYWLGSVLATVPAVAFLERLAVYFRDGYRAINYGVPDLLEVLRQIDKYVNEGQEENAEAQGRAQRPFRGHVTLSFIGHSMGAVVVTNLVRTLSDVFSPSMMSPKAGAADRPDAAGDERHRIGNVYTLGRLVLVSPDIPAETLLQGRANFLQSALGRFREAYLFSNEGDEALRLISTTANYFSFPTQDGDYGYRLGNVSIVRPPKPLYGITNLARLRGGADGEAGQFLRDLQVGHKTLEELLPRGATASAAVLPARFTYFDCTDYQEGGKGVLTFAEGKTHLSNGDHARLLYAFLVKHTPDVHSGYLDAPFSQCLIYRLACLGLRDTLASPPPGAGSQAGLDGWSAACAGHRIQVLLSPDQFHAMGGQRPPPHDRL